MCNFDLNLVFSVCHHIFLCLSPYFSVSECKVVISFQIFLILCSVIKKRGISDRQNFFFYKDHSDKKKKIKKLNKFFILVLPCLFFVFFFTYFAFAFGFAFGFEHWTERRGGDNFKFVFPPSFLVFMF